MLHKNKTILIMKYNKVYLKEKEKEDTRTILEKLYENNSFTEELQEGVKKLIGKKKLTKKDKTNIFTILRGVYLRNDFINKDQDTKAVITAKEEEINEFIESFDNLVKKYKAMLFYERHYKLTGSCNLGRKSFADTNNIDLQKDKFTVQEFINLTKNSYGDDIILKLEKKIKNKVH